ncbi:MAG: SDR family NAD(P)-dependent oxidoreductase, partial [Desulfobacula sp.]|nr:SDR family NAD(P)-dependent oxidoreductase [Desulfobacula sp.]
MEITNKKILITGADGFIGSHLTEKLVKKGCRVKVFVFYNSFNSWGWLDHLPKEITQQIEIFSGDIRDPFGVAAAAKNCDMIFHLAALIAIPYSYHSPATYIDTNVKGTLNIMQAARTHGIEKIIHTSTSEVYGTAQFVPIT